MADETPDPRLRRRALVLRVGAAGIVVPGVAEAQKGPQQPPRTGLTDSDPNDAPGNGRGGQRPQGGGASDRDPNDPPGQGRGQQRPRGPK